MEDLARATVTSPCSGALPASPASPAPALVDQLAALPPLCHIRAGPLPPHLLPPLQRLAALQLLFKVQPSKYPAERERELKTLAALRATAGILRHIDPSFPFPALTVADIHAVVKHVAVDYAGADVELVTAFVANQGIPRRVQIRLDVNRGVFSGSLLQAWGLSTPGMGRFQGFYPPTRVAAHTMFVLAANHNKGLLFAPGLVVADPSQWDYPPPVDRATSNKVLAQVQVAATAVFPGCTHASTTRVGTTDLDYIVRLGPAAPDAFPRFDKFLERLAKGNVRAWITDVPDQSFPSRPTAIDSPRRINVDVVFAPHEAFGATFITWRSAPAYSDSLEREASRKGYILAAGGLFDSNLELTPTPDEATFYKVLKLPHLNRASVTGNTVSR
ncbi:hypothetical protein JCM3770_004830 [Rhodotorula araucariae]